MNATPLEVFLDPEHLPDTLVRLDTMIDRTEDLEKIRAGLGMRLALSMAHELSTGKELGSETGDLVAEWMERYGSDTVEHAVGIARSFILRPKELAEQFATRLGLPQNGEEK